MLMYENNETFDLPYVLLSFPQKEKSHSIYIFTQQLQKIYLSIHWKMILRRNSHFSTTS